MKILFFASIRERLNTDEEQWPELHGAQTIGDVIELLLQRGEPWASTLDSQVLVSLNQELAGLDTIICEDDEIAFFPPVTGG